MRHKMFCRLVSRLPIAKLVDGYGTTPEGSTVPPPEVIPTDVDDSVKVAFVLGWLRKDEWSIGGLDQCPECLGYRPDVAFRTNNGARWHKEKCPLAKSIKLLEEI